MRMGRGEGASLEHLGVLWTVWSGEGAGLGIEWTSQVNSEWGQGMDSESRWNPSSCTF